MGSSDCQLNLQSRRPALGPGAVRRQVAFSYLGCYGNMQQRSHWAARDRWSILKCRSMGFPKLGVAQDDKMVGLQGRQLLKGMTGGSPMTKRTPPFVRLLVKIALDDSCEAAPWGLQLRYVDVDAERVAVGVHDRRLRWGMGGSWFFVPETPTIWRVDHWGIYHLVNVYIAIEHDHVIV